jgi:hypothetical protein
VLETRFRHEASFPSEPGWISPLYFPREGMHSPFRAGGANIIDILPRWSVSSILELAALDGGFLPHLAIDLFLS